jgi:hypothetical protein
MIERKKSGFVFATLLLASQAWAADKTLGLDWTKDSNANQSSVRATFAESVLSGDMNYKVGLGVRHYELEDISIRSIDGSEKSLSKTESQSRAAWGEFLLQRNWSAVSLGASWAGSLGRDPYAGNQATLLAQWRSYELGSALGVTASMGKQNFPQNTFLDRDFVSKERPRVVNRKALALTAEQLVWEGTKVQFQGGYNAENEERPSNMSYELKLAQALWDGRLATHVFGGSLDEERSQQLKNERGYFTVDHYGAKLFVEPIVGNLVELSYVTQEEYEVDPRVSEVRQVSSDIFGLGLHFQVGRLKTKTGASYTVTDTEKTWILKGDLQWELDS